MLLSCERPWTPRELLNYTFSCSPSRTSDSWIRFRFHVVVGARVHSLLWYFLPVDQSCLRLATGGFQAVPCGAPRFKPLKQPALGLAARLSGLWPLPVPRHGQEGSEGAACMAVASLSPVGILPPKAKGPQMSQKSVASSQSRGWTLL